ncbi:MAG: cytidine deaminase [Myxococcaceae bacterium]|nr:cytidine deaminase [Myxococcaceae bacterium]
MAEDIPWEQLFDAARAAQQRAYAPYSKFPVGAAVLAEDGRVHAGANVENSSYGLTVCAERNAIARAVAEGATRVRAVAVVANTKRACPPCGMCRQVIAEFADPDTPVRSRAPGGDEARYTLGELLPHAFTRDYL